MNDDTERRLRESLRGANLPAAPETLRASMRGISSAPAPAPAPARRSWLRAAWAVPALAAVVVVAVVAGALTGGFGRVGPAVSSALPSAVASPAASAPGAPATASPSVAAVPTGVSVLTPTLLAADVRAVQSGAAVAHDVVAAEGIETVANPNPASLECQDPLGTCVVIGRLPGSELPVTLRAEEQILPPPTTSDSLTGPVVLRLVPGGPIEYLGHADVQGATGQVDVAGLKALTTTTPAGNVVAVHAWLSGVSFSCGPMSSLPAPFNCPGSPSFLSDQPAKGAIIDDHPSAAPGSSITPIQQITGNIPASAVLVQMGAYQAFAPSPDITDGVNGTPREGLYLVRMVTVDTSECAKCRGWLMVGRLDSAPSASSPPSASPSAGQRVYSAGELAAALAANRAAFIGKAVIVDGKVTPGSPSDCSDIAGSPGFCALGTLKGTQEDVVATPYTASLLLPDTDYPTNGQMAMIVRDSGLEYLGWMGYVNGNDFVASLSDLAHPESNARGPETVIVSAWLGTSGPLPCPAVPGSPPPADTPFDVCPFTWLASTAKQRANGQLPDGAVKVQYAAYGDFAGSAAGSTAPVDGTYLVRLVTDTRQGADGPRGWQVVARLAP